MPPYRWQLEARIRRAQQLLLEPNANIAEVASQTGFADQLHSPRAFRQLIGATPRAWQRACRD